MASAIDPSKPVAGSPTTESVRQNFAAAKSEIEVLQQTAGIGPQGPIGPVGPSGTITIGTVTTGPAGGSASVTNSGSATAATLNFTLPRGDSGTGGSGITETQAIEAVRTGHPDFAEVPVTVAVAPAAPNIAEDPVVNTGWTPADGSGPTDTFNHTSGTGVLAYPISGGLPPGGWIQVSFNSVNNTVPFMSVTATSVPTLFTVYLRTGPTTTGNQITLGAAVVIAGSRLTQVVNPSTSSSTYTHLVVVPASSFNGSFTLTYVYRRNGVLNSSAFEIKGVPFINKGDMLAIGGGGVTCTPAATMTTLGVEAGQKTTTGVSHVLVGYRAGWNLTTGNASVAVGNLALTNQLSGNYNVAIGTQTMEQNVTGENNAGLGYACLHQNKSGSENTAVGSIVMQYNQEGNRNTAVGRQALNDKRQGDDNVAFGFHAGRYIAPATTANPTINRSVFLGANTRSLGIDQTNEIVIGYSANGHGSNTITLGNSDITAIHCNVQSITALSDSRVKEDIQPADLDKCVDAVKKLAVHRWAWQAIAGKRRDKHVTGFLADSVKQVFPKAVTEQDEHLTVRDEDGKAQMTTVSEIVQPPGDEEQPHVETREVEKTVEMKNLQRVEMTEIVPTLWGAVQRLIEKNEALEKQIKQMTPNPADSSPAPNPQESSKGLFRKR